ncbi:hypothetical protein Tco_0449031 [Tanacetum coccineum]
MERGFAAALAILITEASQSRQHGMSEPRAHQNALNLFFYCLTNLVFINDILRSERVVYGALFGRGLLYVFAFAFGYVEPSFGARQATASEELLLTAPLPKGLLRCGSKNLPAATLLQTARSYAPLYGGSRRVRSHQFSIRHSDSENPEEYQIPKRRRTDYGRYSPVCGVNLALSTASGGPGCCESDELSERDRYEERALLLTTLEAKIEHTRPVRPVKAL